MLSAHARGRSLSSNSTTYYVPVLCVEPLLQAKAAFEALDCSTIHMRVIPFSPGDPAVVCGRLRIVAFPTLHRVQSQGYAVLCPSEEVSNHLDHRSPKRTLKAEYRGLPPHDIGMLKKSGVDIYESGPAGSSSSSSSNGGDAAAAGAGPLDNANLSSLLSRCSVEVVYTGDTTIAGLRHPDVQFIFRANIFITELTYMDGRREKAEKYAHIHVEDIAEAARDGLFDNVKSLVFVHLSSQYNPHGRALAMLRETSLPEEIKSKCWVALKGFGATEPITRVSFPYNSRDSDTSMGSRVRRRSLRDGDGDDQDDDAGDSGMEWWRHGTTAEERATVGFGWASRRR